MDIVSRFTDHLIESKNILVETTIGEYLEIAQKIIKNNNLQRKKVGSSKSIYSLLKDDLIKGCIIPPLTLAITSTADFQNEEELSGYIKKNPEDVLILDGLQRTHTMISAHDEVKKNRESEDVEKFLNQKLRLEIYVGINKFGILYRMLTLNTGQTRMSTRHQIEILYGSIVDKEPIKIDDSSEIKLVAETEGKVTKSLREFKFSDVIEGFTSYIQRDELPIDRQDILDYLDMLSNLQNENTQSDIFKEFVVAYSNLIVKLQEIFGDEEIDLDNFEDYLGSKIDITLFGKSVVKIFNTPQAMCGFGAAIGHLKDYDSILSFEGLVECYDKITSKSEDGKEWLLILLIKMDDLKNKAKKIGNEQRMFFQYFFRELFNNVGNSYLDLEKAVTNGYQKYKSQV